VIVAAARDDDQLDGRLLDLLRDWLPGRRWFPAKGAEIAVELCAAIELPSTTDRVRVLLLTVHGADADTLLQVPLVLTDQPAGDHPVVGRLDGRTVLDGSGHPAFLAGWLALADGPSASAPVRASLDPGTARVLTGEQSNTSIVLSASAAPVAILKVLRSPVAGANPDVEVPRRLVEVGWSGVPAPLGWLQATWPQADGTLAQGYLGALAAFVPRAADGFELACSYARRAAPFEEMAAELGTVVAGMHEALRQAFGTWPDAGPDPTGDPPAPGPAAVARPARPGDLPLPPAPPTQPASAATSATGGARAVAAAVAERFAWAAEAVPALSGYARGVRQVVAELARFGPTPARQRVHGDLHLGQVLRSGGRWFITDFEGEPLAPLAERTRPDLAVRDVAGVLRSFDYAAAVGGLTGGTADEWVTACRAAFLASYQPAAGTDLLVRALELDKALYEAVYEARNRPTWLHIPIAGLDRLLQS
jgi:maltokinase